MVTGGHKEGKNEGKPETVRMPVSFDLNISRFNGLSIMQDIFSLLCELFEFESYGR